MRKHYRRFLSLCYADSWMEVGKRVLRGHYDNAWTVGSVLLGKKSLGK
jgi:hypothetical protein